MVDEQQYEDENGARKTGLIIGALALAAVAVVGVLAWMTGSFPAQQPAEEPQPITVEVVETPFDQAQGEPSDIARITPEAAMLDVAPTPAVAGVSTSADTGPAENMLLLSGILMIIGLSGSIWVAKRA